MSECNTSIVNLQSKKNKIIKKLLTNQDLCAIMYTVANVHNGLCAVSSAG